MKMILSLIMMTLMTLLSTETALALSQADLKGAEFALNKASPEGMRKYQLGSLETVQKKWVMKATYDFALQGGSSAAAISLKGPDGANAVLPKKAVIHNCIIDVLTAPTSSGTSTIAIGTGQAANDLKTATATGSYTGLVACVPVGSAATSIKLTADRTPTLTVANSTLTAGKINVLIEYYVSD